MTDLARGRRPPGRPTRGKTAPNRLRRTDVWLTVTDPALACLGGGRLYVDLGFGADPATTLETAARLGAVGRVVGVEIDRARVERAAAFAVPGRVEFRLGGFDLPLGRGEQVGVVRAMNVLRQYDEADHAPAVARLRSALADGGVLLEGTSTPSGRLMAFHAYGPTSYAGLVLSVNLRRAWEPREVQTHLPKDLIHRCGPGSALDRFFGAWQDAVAAARRRGLGPRAVFARAAHDLAAAGHDIDRTPALLRLGFLRARRHPAGWVSP